MLSRKTPMWCIRVCVSVCVCVCVCVLQEVGNFPVFTEEIVQDLCLLSNESVA